MRARLDRPDILLQRGGLSLLPEMLRKTGICTPILVTTPRRRFVEAIGRDMPVIALAQDHCPAGIVAAARAELSAQPAADGLIALGGGSAIGLGKALADSTGLPLVNVPTSYAGSALTAGYGILRDGRKHMHRSDRAMAQAVIYDADLYDDFTGPAACASAFNAMAHAIDPLFDTGLMDSTATSLRAVSMIASALPRRADEPADTIVEGAMLAAISLDLGGGSGGPGLHHRLCHLVGGKYGTAHGPTHAALLPYTTALRRHSHTDVFAAISKALDSNDAAGHLHRLAHLCGLTGGLAPLGAPSGAVAVLAKPLIAAGFSKNIATDMMQRAWEGIAP